MARIYGIDLGTTYSCIAYVDEYGQPVVVPNAEGQPTTPSVVFFENSGNIVVGKHAKDVAALYPDRVVSTVKRVMGDPDWVFEADGRTYHPQDISSFILRKLIADAQVVTGDTISEVVITCPAYFGVTQKEATRQAGMLADLNVRSIIPEPTAAAIAYALKHSEEGLKDQVVLVFDLGGGTFDVTLIEMKQVAPTVGCPARSDHFAATSEGEEDCVPRPEITVVCTGGDDKLGGKNWDDAIATWFAEQFSSEVGVAANDLTSDPETWQDLLNSAENAKVALSSRGSYPQQVRYDVDCVKVELTREKFYELTAHLLERTISLTEELLVKARSKGHSKIDKLLLVGGSTYMPQVINTVKMKFPFEVSQFDPNQAVAKGAALFGLQDYLGEQVRIRTEEQAGEDGADGDAGDARANAERELARDLGMTLPGVRILARTKIRNVTSKSFGIVVAGRSADDMHVNNLIIVDEAVPRVISRRFFTCEENQLGVTLRCMENTERVGPDDPPIPLDTSTEVGSAELRFTRPLPAESPIEITFSLGEDGLLTVHGKDLTTDQEIRAEFKTPAILSNEELEEKKTRNMAITVA